MCIYNKIYYINIVFDMNLNLQQNRILITVTSWLLCYSIDKV